ncbi:MAG: hypothetical protein AAF196_06900 [Planctomycetota bacterium]
MKTKLLVPAVLVLLGGCSPPSDGTTPTFDFATFESTQIDVRVVDESDNPVRGASVTVEDVYLRTLEEEDDARYGVYFRGVTDANGEISASVRFPGGVTQVDVIVNAAGKTGAWTDTDLRDELGFFAPSSRQTETVDASIALDVALNDR